MKSGKRAIAISAAFAAFMAVTILPSAAQAWIKVCNQSGITAYVAIGLHEASDRVRVSGWERVDAGQCEVVNNLDISNYDWVPFYLHAEDADGGTNWGDGIWLCGKTEGDFSALMDPSDSQCHGGRDPKEFTEVRISDRGVHNYTWTIN